MRKFFQRKYAMSAEGAKDLIKSTLWTVLMDLSFMLPVILSFQFLDTYLQAILTGAGIPESSILHYAILSAAAFIVMFTVAYIQYQATYTKIYKESALRRISLAETLRKLPLAFFGRKDVADLSSTIMEDATQIEQLFSHAVPQIYASGVTVTLMAVMLFLYSWQLSLAVFWVVPIAIFVFFLSRRLQITEHRSVYHIKRDISDTMQEGLETVHEIKSYNREADYTAALDTKLDAYEKKLVKGELLIGASINVSYVILKLGLPTMVLAGAYLMASGTVSVFTYIVFLLIASRIYNPLMEVNEQHGAAHLPQRAHQPHEGNGRHAPAGRRRRFSVQELRYRVSECGLFLSGRRANPEKRQFYGQAGRGHRACRPLRRRKEHGSKAFRSLLGYR